VELQAQCEQVSQQLAASSQQKTELQARCEQVSQQEEGLQARIGQLAQQLVDSQVESAQQAELLAIKTEIEAQSQARLNAVQAEATESRNKLLQIGAQVQDCASFYNSLEVQNHDQQKRIAQLEATVSDLEQEKKTLVAESEAKIEEHSIRVKSLLDDILKKFGPTEDHGPQPKRQRSEYKK
jgi:chromosome segregation ATPase